MAADTEPGPGDVRRNARCQSCEIERSPASQRARASGYGLQQDPCPNVGSGRQLNTSSHERRLYVARFLKSSSQWLFFFKTTRSNSSSPVSKFPCHVLFPPLCLICKKCSEDDVFRHGTVRDSSSNRICSLSKMFSEVTDSNSLKTKSTTTSLGLLLTTATRFC